MSFRPARRVALWLRLPALALLLLAVLANPVLAAVGDLHGATRGVASHLHDSDEHALTDDNADHDEAGDLMHAAHCCGHLSAIPSRFFLMPVRVVHAAMDVAEMRAPSSHIPALRLRPPIAA
ncbi:hypothetical protein SAMN05428989_1725 [Pseudoxanthomonas sp. GM95]|uniref:hypothetical protein n=1 Tax=Pseudoxanthomonas sp. GM95 TaxID=1881043 RepID=UPI0008D4E18F|nr:hypothetical protein [Pseudoxanthomonas sp. GM95]SEL47349.1 hypothetical protein SAMN05428989_1725 [Pseudoxanthomonas sp. GM95]